MTAPGTPGKRNSSAPPSQRWAWERAIRSSDLPSQAKLLALTIGTYLDPAATCFVSNTRLAKDTSTSEATVKRWKRVLQGKCAEVTNEVWLIVDGKGGRRRSDGRGIASTFIAVIPPARRSAATDANGLIGEPVPVVEQVHGDASRSLPPTTGSSEVINQVTGEPPTEVEQTSGAEQPSAPERSDTAGCPCGGTGWLSENTICMTHRDAAYAA